MVGTVDGALNLKVQNGATGAGRMIEGHKLMAETLENVLGWDHRDEEGALTLEWLSVTLVGKMF